MALRALLCGLLLVLLPVLGCAAEVLAVIVPPSHQSETLSREDLALIFRRQKTFWPDGRRIQPVNLPPDSAERGLFSRAVFERETQALDDYWRQRYFQGVRPPYVVASTEAMLRFVAETANAIGYVNACAVDARVVVAAVLDERGLRPPQPLPDCKVLQ